MKLDFSDSKRCPSLNGAKRIRPAVDGVYEIGSMVVKEADLADELMAERLQFFVEVGHQGFFVEAEFFRPFGRPDKAASDVAQTDDDGVDVLGAEHDQKIIGPGQVLDGMEDGTVIFFWCLRSQQGDNQVWRILIFLVEDFVDPVLSGFHDLDVGRPTRKDRFQSPQLLCETSEKGLFGNSFRGFFGPVFHTGSCLLQRTVLNTIIYILSIITLKSIGIAGTAISPSIG
ncbi:MAG: hypothetical protein AB7J40_01435 [Candidatus Altimarinota bacterium]